MTIGLFISAIIAPALLWLLYFRYQDRFRPEPFRILGLTYLLGILAGLLCARFYLLLPYMGLPWDPAAVTSEFGPACFFQNVLVVGPVEEVFKFLPFLFVIYHFRHFDEEIDGIIYASVIALGFASYENLHYLPYMGSLELVGRAVASPLTHTIFSSIWGYMVGRARHAGRSIIVPSIVGLLTASLLHGIFNVCTVTPLVRILSSVIILLVWIWRIRTMERLGRGERIDLTR